MATDILHGLKTIEPLRGKAYASKMNLQSNSSHPYPNGSRLFNESYYQYNDTEDIDTSDSGCTYYDYDPDYDYYNIVDRAIRNLSKTHYIIALVLGTVAVIANTISLAAVFKVRKVWSSHFSLLVSLMISDLLVDFSVIFYIVNKVTNPGTQAGVGPVGMRLKSRCAFMIIKALNTMALNVTLMNLMGMALDHYLAIIKPLHHGILLDKNRTTMLILSFWMVAFISGFSDFLSPLWNFKKYLASIYNYCEFVWITPYQEEYTMFAIALLCLCLMIFMYIRIYHKVHARTQRQDMSRIARSRQALLTTLLILGSFIICWLPTCLFQIVLLVIANVNPVLIQNVYQCLLYVDKYLYDLLILNTLFDPIIYVIRINEVQVGYRIMFLRCCPRKLQRDISSTITKSEYLFHSRNNSVTERSMHTMSINRSCSNNDMPAWYKHQQNKNDDTPKIPLLNIMPLKCGSAV